MADKPDSPLGKFLGFVGFLAGFSIGWQYSDQSFIAALIVGIIVAALGTLIGNVITGVLIVATAVVIAAFFGLVRQTVVQEVIVPVLSQSVPSSEPPELTQLPASQETTPSIPSEIPGGPPANVDSNILNACNRTEDPVIVALGYREKEVWLAKGWYRIESGHCARLISNTPPVIYAYAVSAAWWSEGLSWITDKEQAQFCVDSRNAFELSNAPCQNAVNPDYRFQVFGAVMLQEIGTCTWELEPRTWKLDCDSSWPIS